MASGNEIAFLFIGGAHQVFHLAPVAAELSRKLPQTTVTCIYPDDEIGTALQEVKATYGAQSMMLDHVPPPRWGEAQIGRASCRERVCQYGVDLGGRRIIKKKRNGRQAS